MAATYGGIEFNVIVDDKQEGRIQALAIPDLKLGTLPVPGGNYDILQNMGTSNAKLTGIKINISSDADMQAFIALLGSAPKTITDFMPGVDIANAKLVAIKNATRPHYDETEWEATVDFQITPR